MNDQPKPATGEWTWDQVDDLYRALGIMGIVKCHNAALAAEHEKYIELCDKANGDMIALNKQLAAERRKREEEGAEFSNISARAIQLQEQLAAERERTKTLVDALKEVELYRHSWDTTHPCSLVADIAKDALSKVNQNWIRAEDNPGFHRHE